MLAAWLAVAVPTAINAGAAASTAPAATRRIQLVVVVLAVISILLSARVFRRCAPAMYLLCRRRRDVSVRQPVRARDELDVLQLTDIWRGSGEASCLHVDDDAHACCSGGSRCLYAERSGSGGHADA